MAEISIKKNRGVVYTPPFLVKLILDLSDYRGSNIRGKHIIDNSCGDGAFLREIVDRYCSQCLERSTPSNTIKRELETYIHAIEIDAEAVSRCRVHLDAVAQRYGIVGVEWDVKAGDATSASEFDARMDFVVGNPPYVRIHNITRSSSLKKEFSLFQEGMSDLYIAFFEIGLRMLNAKGTLGYVTPSSYFNSVAGAKLRECFVKNRLLKKVVDFKHSQAFDDATTYTAITVLQKGRNEEDRTLFYEYDEVDRKPRRVCELQARDYYLAGKFFFARQAELNLLRDIFCGAGDSGVSVKNGFATLCDSVFVSASFPFRSKHIIPVVKASKGLRQYIIFPYDENSRPLSEEELKRDEELYRYLLSRREQLLSRSLEKSGREFWFLYGRSQGIADVFKEKLTLNTLIRNISDLKILNVPSGVGVYGGLYITSSSVPLSAVRVQLRSDEFVTYAALLGKYKSGGYYAFSSKDVKKFLDYKLARERATS